MQTNNKDSILLKKLILSRYNFLSDVAKKLKIDLSTLSRKIKKPSRVFLEELKSIEIPIPDDMLNPPIEKIKVHNSSALPGCATFRITFSIVCYRFYLSLLCTC